MVDRGRAKHTGKTRRRCHLKTSRSYPNARRRHCNDFDGDHTVSSPSGLAQSSGSVAREAVSGPPGRTGLPSGFTGEFVADVNGVRLHYVIGGPNDGPLVLLLHDWPQTWYTWRNVMPPLAQAGYRVVAVDYRGAGTSEKPQGGYEGDYGRGHSWPGERARRKQG